MSGALALEACTIDLERGRVLRADGAELRLTDREAALLAYLAARANQAVPREELLAAVWGYGARTVSRATDNAVRRLREKIERDPANPAHLLTAHGAGYRLVLAAPAAPPPEPEPRPGGSLLHFEGIEVDLLRRCVRRGGEELPLTEREAALLAALAGRPGQAIGRDALAREAWGLPRGGGRAVDNAVHRLRARLEPDPARPRWLLTARGSGYRLALPERAEIADDDSAFVGRAAEQAEIARLLAGGARLIALTGPGGAGKTRLARRVAAEAAQRWPGGARWCDAEPARDGDGLARALAAALGLAPGPAADPLDLAVRALAREGDCLLLLDNLEHVAAPAAALAARLLAEAPRARLLATSRVRLDVPGEHVLEIGPLPPDDGAELLRRRARAAGVSAADVAGSRGQVDALVAALEGMPLGIELAAARLRVLSLADLLARRAEALDLLQRRGAAGGRHGSLRSTIAVSWGLLRPAEQDALAALTRFRAPFTAESAAAALGAPLGDALALLQELRDQSLLYTAEAGGSTRLGMYVAIRAFAEERRGALPPEAAARFARWCAAWGRDERLDALDGAGGDALFRALRAELDNLIGGVEAALEAGLPEEAAWACLAALRALTRVGPAAAGVDLAARVLGAAPLPAGLEARLRLASGRLLRWADRYDEAFAALERAVSLAEQAGEPRLRADTCYFLGHLHVERYRPDEARRWWALAAGHAERAGWRALAVWIEAKIAQWEGAAGGERAAARFAEAIALARAGGHVRLEATARNGLGRVARSEGRLLEARAEVDAAVALYRQLGERYEEGLIRTGFLPVLLRLGDQEALEREIPDLLALLQEIGSQADEAVVRAYHGDLLARTERLEAAGEAYAASRRLVISGDEILASYLDLREAELFAARGDLASATSRARQALARADAAGLPSRRAHALSVLGDVMTRQGELDAAAAALAAAEAELRERGEPEDLAILMVRRALLAAARGDEAEARSAHAEAEALARRAGPVGPGTELGAQLARLASAQRTR